MCRGRSRRCPERDVPPYATALVHAGLGERDEVFAWLDRAHDARDAHLVFLTVDPKWDPTEPIPGSRRFWSVVDSEGPERESR